MESIEARFRRIVERQEMEELLTARDFERTSAAMFGCDEQGFTSARGHVHRFDIIDRALTRRADAWLKTMEDK